MPRIINIVPKDIYFITEYRLDELKKIKVALENCTVSCKDKEAMEYFSKNFYNFICDCIEEVEGKEEDGSRSNGQK